MSPPRPCGRSLSDEYPLLYILPVGSVAVVILAGSFAAKQLKLVYDYQTIGQEDEDEEDASRVGGRTGGRL